MRKGSKRSFKVSAFLATTALCIPSIAIAATPAPKFTSPDNNEVDLTTGLPWMSVEEGGIGSGPGRVTMQRIYAEGAGFVDNWSGGLFDVTSGGVTKKYVQVQGISDTFSGSGTSWTSDKGDGATLTYDQYGTPTYTARDGSTIAFLNGPFGDGGSFCPGSDSDSCRVASVITRPDGMKFTLGWNTARICVMPDGVDCGSWEVFYRLSTVTSSAGYKLTVTYLTNVVGSGTSPQPNWYIRTSVAFTNTANPPSPLPTISYSYGVNTVSTTDPAGRTWVFTTDSSGRLTGVERPGSSSYNISYAYGADGTASSATTDGVTDTYARSVSGSTATETVTDPLSHQKVITSDTNLDQPTSYKDELSRTTSYAYDSNSRLTKLTYPEGNYNQYSYDARGNLTTLTKVAKSGSGLANIVTSASYDSTCSNVITCNEPNSTTDANGNVTTYAYDPTHGGVLTVTQPAPTTGAIQPQTRYSYSQVTSASGALVYMMTGVSACQTTASCTGGADETKIAAAYNSNLLPTSVTRADGMGALTATTAMTYTPTGDLDTVDGPLSGTADTTKYRYDAADQLIGVTSPSPGNGQPDRAIRITYRPDGQVSKKELGTVTDQTDTAWTNFSPLQTLDISFDSNSRPIQQKLSAGGTAYALTQTSYDADGRVDCTAVRMNTSTYGSLPAACSQTSGSPDRISENVYDAAGELTQQKVGVGTTAAATEETLTYTNDGLVQSILDGENNLTAYTYDGFDRLSDTYYPNLNKGADDSNGSDYAQLTYDANSNVTQRRVRSGSTISCVYDALNRVTHLNGATLATRDFTYDNLGRMLTAIYSTNGQGITNTWNALGELTSSSSNMGGTAELMSYGYDLAGRRTSVSYPTVVGTPDLTVTYNYLTTGEVKSISDGATSLASYGYDALGNRANVTYGDGVTQTYTYDPVSRLTILNNDLAGTTYDLSIGTSTNPISYNAASQITSLPKTNDAYAWTGAVNVTRGYTSNGLNQYTAAGPASFTYDANGNLAGDGTWTYTYDSQNDLTSAADASINANLSYDPVGRLWKLAGSGIGDLSFVSDGNEIAAVYAVSTGGLENRYVFGPGVDEPIVQYDASGNRTWLISDERGSIIALPDANGNASSSRINSYDESGIPGSTNNGRYQYTGQFYLSQIGLDYFKARFYSPTLGRFLQTDPIGYGDGPNWYAYVHNDPINFDDPLGLAGCESTASELVVCGRRLPENPIAASLTFGGSDRASGAGGSAGPVIVVVGKPHHNRLCTSSIRQSAVIQGLDNAASFFNAVGYASYGGAGLVILFGNPEASPELAAAGRGAFAISTLLSTISATIKVENSGPTTINASIDDALGRAIPGSNPISNMIRQYVSDKIEGELDSQLNLAGCN